MVNIVNAQWSDGDVSRAQEMISGEIAKAGGEVLNIGSMGRRKLAYPINGQGEGLYVVSHFNHPTEGLIPLRDSLKLNTPVIRTLIVRYRHRPSIEMEGEGLNDTAPALSETEPVSYPSESDENELPKSGDELTGDDDGEDYESSDTPEEDENENDSSPGGYRYRGE